MSELFSWLKRAGEERGREPSTVGTEVLSPPVQAEETGSDGAGAPAVESPEPPTTVERPSVETRDLRLAAVHVKEALDPVTVVGEQFRLLRSELALIQKTKSSKSLLVTSALPGEGKTFVASAVAGVLAQEPGKRVLLVDADLRKGQVHKTLGLNAGGPVEGLCQILQGEAALENVMVRFSDSEMSFIPSGSLPHNPAELLSSQTLSRMMSDLSRMFDWIVVDSPPVLGLADGNVLSALCDATLLVVQANKTPTKLVKEAMHRIGNDKICGVVLNRVKRARSYRYYYGYRGKEKKRGAIGRIFSFGRK